MIGNKGWIKPETALVLFLIVFLGLGVYAYTHSQANSRSLGGTTTITLEPGEKLEEITWKDEDASLWYLTRPMRDDETAETYTFKQSSVMGIIEGTVIVIEQNAEDAEND